MNPDNFRHLKLLFSVRPAMVIDIGARNGFGMLKPLHPFLNIHAIEPEHGAAEELRKQDQRQFGSYHVHQVAISREEGEAVLHVARNGSMSSLLKPDFTEFKRSFGESKNAQDWIRELETIEEQKVKTTTLQKFFDDHQLSFVELVKIDSQGNELDILKSGEELLKNDKVGVLCVETAMLPVYEGQSYFSDVDVFLRACGYHLVDFRTYPEIAERESEMSLDKKIYERSKSNAVGDAWYTKDWNSSFDRKQYAPRLAFILACEGYLSEAAYLLGSLLKEDERNSLFEELYRLNGDSRTKQFLKRWTPLAVQQWRARMKKR